MPHTVDFHAKLQDLWQEEMTTRRKDCLDPMLFQISDSYFFSIKSVNTRMSGETIDLSTSLRNELRLTPRKN